MTAAAGAQVSPLIRALPLVVVFTALALGIAALRWLNIDWEAIASLGYVGLFLVNLAASATVAVPVPGVIAVFFAGKVLNPALVGLSAGVGSALGELSGYALGRSGRVALNSAVIQSRVAQRLEGWVRRYGFLTILVLAFIPNPLFDMAGMMAGAAMMEPKVFLLAVLIGKSVRMVLIALAGMYALEWLVNLL